MTMSHPTSDSSGRPMQRPAWRRLAGLILNSNGRGDGPPDLDELWRDFNRKLSGLFGGKGGGGTPPRGSGDGGGGPSFQPDMKSAGIGAVLVTGVVAAIWIGSGFFIVQEGQQAVVTSFGRYSHTVDAGFQWRMPYPFQANETVNVTQLRSKEVGRNAVIAATGLRDSSMLTQDENIVDIRFTVQYRLKDAKNFLFRNDTDHYIWVHGSSDGVTVTFTLYGTKDGRKVKSTFSGWTHGAERTTETTVDENVGPGTTVIERAGQSARSCTVTRLVTMPDGTVLHKGPEIYQSTYPMISRVIGVSYEDAAGSPGEKATASSTTTKIRSSGN